MGKYKLKNGMIIDTIQQLAVIVDEKFLLPKDIQEGGKYHDWIEEVIEKPYKRSDKVEGYVCLIPPERMIGKRDALKVLPKYFETKEQFKEYFKDFDLGTLELFAKAICDEKYMSKPTSYYQTHRIHMHNALRKYYFPDERRTVGAKQRKTKYSQYSTPDLMRLARINKVQFKINAHPAIQRMYVVTALEKAGVLTKDDIVAKTRITGDPSNTPENIVVRREKRKTEKENTIVSLICQQLAREEDLPNQEKFAKMKLSSEEEVN